MLSHVMERDPEGRTVPGPDPNVLLLTVGDRGGNEDIRIICARKTTQRERKQYEEGN